MNSQKYLYLIQQIGSIERSISNDSLTEEQRNELTGALNICRYTVEAARARGVEIENAIKSGQM